MKYWWGIGELKTISADAHLNQYIDRLSPECRPTIDRLSVDIWIECRSTLDRYIDQLSPECRPAIDRLSVNISVECRSTVDRYIDRQRSRLPTVNMIRLVNNLNPPPIHYEGTKPPFCEHLHIARLDYLQQNR